MFLLLALLATVCQAKPQAEQVHLAFQRTHLDISVSWVTLFDADSFLLYGSDQDHLVRLSGTKKEWIYGGITRFMHTVVLESLSPDTVYIYKVAPDYTAREFKTLPKVPTSYKVAIFGDLGLSNSVTMRKILEMAEFGDIDFIIHTGNIAYSLQSLNGAIGDDFMKKMEPAVSKVPYMVVPGNRENEGNSFENYQNRFAMPNNGSASNDMFYSFEIGPIHFVGINTEAYTTTDTSAAARQEIFLAKDSKFRNKNMHPWVISLMNRPMYCSVEYPTNCTDATTTKIRSGDRKTLIGLETLFSVYPVDISFAAHQDIYERSFPVLNGVVTNTKPHKYNNEKAPIHVISGSPGCSVKPDSISFLQNIPDFSAVRSKQYTYSILNLIDSGHINFQQYAYNDTDGSTQLIDHFDITKTV